MHAYITFSVVIYDFYDVFYETFFFLLDLVPHLVNSRGIDVNEESEAAAADDGNIKLRMNTMMCIRVHDTIALI